MADSPPEFMSLTLTELEEKEFAAKFTEVPCLELISLTSLGHEGIAQQEPSPSIVRQANTTDVNGMVNIVNDASPGDGDNLKASHQLGEENRASHKRKREPSLEPVAVPQPPPRQRQELIYPRSHQAPWLHGFHHHGSQHPIEKLHYEIEAFYEFVEPREFEINARNLALTRITSVLGRHPLFKNCRLVIFGSFATNLHLPTGDIDVSVVLRDFDPSTTGNSDLKITKEKAVDTLKCARKLLVKHGMTTRTDNNLIIHARIPLLKFREELTGVHIDLSCNNTGGLKAIETVKGWMATWPALAPLLMVLKRILMARDLNDVATQGLGSFALICLLVNFFRHRPGAEGPYGPQSESSEAKLGYGQLLLEFLDFYGNKFDRVNQAIRMEDSCWGHIPKPPMGRGRGPIDKFAIFDPNNPGNDISSGTLRATDVARAFNDTRWMLMQSFGIPYSERQSFLGAVLRGDYSDYINQREHLRKLMKDVTDEEKTGGAMGEYNAKNDGTLSVASGSFGGSRPGDGSRQEYTNPPKKGKWAVSTSAKLNQTVPSALATEHHQHHERNQRFAVQRGGHVPEGRNRGGRDNPIHTVPRGGHGPHTQTPGLIGTTAGQGNIVARQAHRYGGMTESSTHPPGTQAQRGRRRQRKRLQKSVAPTTLGPLPQSSAGARAHQSQQDHGIVRRSQPETDPSVDYRSMPR